MNFWRRVIADRHSGRLLGLLLALSFAIQTLVTGFATAAMAAPDPSAVICSTVDGVHRPGETGRDHDCPCRMLCFAGLHAQSVLAPGDGPGLPIRLIGRLDPQPHAVPVVQAAHLPGVYHARAPPVPAAS